MTLNFTTFTTEPSQILSDSITLIITIVNELYINAIIATLGTAANILNCVVFLKQGTRDTVNISLLALAMADIGSLTTGLMYSVCSNPVFVNPSIPLAAGEFQSLFVTFPGGTLGRIASCIMAYITFERCLCVVLPLKVKRIITTKVTVVVIVIIYTGLALTVIPFYLKYNFGWRFDYKMNRTILGIVTTHYTGPADYNTSLTIHVTLELASFFFTLLFTIAIILEIKRQSRWRWAITGTYAITSNPAQQKMSKTVTMVATLASVHIVCYTPSVAVLAAILVLPGFNMNGSLHDVYQVSVSMTTVFESVNSSLRIVLYYASSAKFRLTVRKCFQKC